MERTVSQMDLCAWLGTCLQYPDDKILEIWQLKKEFEDLLDSEASACLQKFFDQMGSMEFSKRQEHYVHSFDVLPQCPLYLSVHLFGEESFKRSELMAGLKSVYERNGAAESAELPDHLSVVLKQSRFLSEEEWTDLVTCCILPVLPKMITELEKHSNPYAWLLKALRLVLLKMERVHV